MSDKQQLENNDKIVEYDNIIYLINSEENAASVIGIKNNHNEIMIPRSINHESKEYYVISILSNSFKNFEAEFVQFAPNSEIQTIDKDAFSYSIIKSIKIPSSFTSIG